MKTYWGSEDIAPRILNLDTRWRWVVSFTPRPFYPQGKSLWYPMHRRLGGTQSRSGRGGEEKNSQLLPGLEPPIIQPLAQRYTSELSRLLPIHYSVPRGMQIVITVTNRTAQNCSFIKVCLYIKCILHVFVIRVIAPADASLLTKHYYRHDGYFYMFY
jgi:hypothetical protein